MDGGFHGVDSYGACRGVVIQEILVIEDTPGIHGPGQPQAVRRAPSTLFSPAAGGEEERIGQTLSAVLTLHVEEVDDWPHRRPVQAEANPAEYFSEIRGFSPRLEPRGSGADKRTLAGAEQAKHPAPHSDFANLGVLVGVAADVNRLVVAPRVDDEGHVGDLSNL